jgi:hypothetical protein
MFFTPVRPRPAAGVLFARAIAFEATIRIFTRPWRPLGRTPIRFTCGGTCSFKGAILGNVQFQSLTLGFLCYLGDARGVRDWSRETNRGYLTAVPRSHVSSRRLATDASTASTVPDRGAMTEGNHERILLAILAILLLLVLVHMVVKVSRNP